MSTKERPPKPPRNLKRKRTNSNNAIPKTEHKTNTQTSLPPSDSNTKITTDSPCLTLNRNSKKKKMTKIQNTTDDDACVRCDPSLWLSMLPSLVICHICENLNVPDILRLSKVCVRFYDLFWTTQEFWKIKARNVLSRPPNNIDPKDFDWRKFSIDENYRVECLFGQKRAVTTICSPSSFERKVLGASFESMGYRWRPIIFPRGNKADFLSVYLELLPDSPRREHNIDDGYCSGDFYVRVINHKDSRRSVFKVGLHNFSRAQSDQGWSRTVELSELYNPSGGFLRDDSIVIETGIIPPKQFPINVYISFKVFTEESLVSHSGRELIDIDTVPTFQLFATDTLQCFLGIAEKRFGIPRSQQQYWRLIERLNDTVRPQVLLTEEQLNKPIYMIFGRFPVKGLFIRRIKPLKRVTRSDSSGDHISAANFLPDSSIIIAPCDKTQTRATIQPQSRCPNHILLFSKYFNSVDHTLKYAGCFMVSKESTLSNLEPFFSKLLEKLDPSVNKDGEAQSTTAPFLFFEELKTNRLPSLNKPDNKSCTLKSMELQDGDIIIFQKNPNIRFKNEIMFGESVTYEDPLSQLKSSYYADQYASLFSSLLTVAMSSFPSDFDLTSPEPNYFYSRNYHYSCKNGDHIQISPKEEKSCMSKTHTSCISKRFSQMGFSASSESKMYQEYEEIEECLSFVATRDMFSEEFFQLLSTKISMPPTCEIRLGYLDRYTNKPKALPQFGVLTLAQLLGLPSAVPHKLHGEYYCDPAFSIKMFYHISPKRN